MMMKKMMMYSLAIMLIAGVGCRKIEMDGPGNAENNNNGNANTVVLTGRITKNTLLKKGDHNLLSGKVYVAKGATLTIEKGAVVKANYSGADVAVLVVARGGKLVAEGSQNEPIVFTSSSPDPRSGDWGGIVLCGTASLNNPSPYLGHAGLMQVEGGIDNEFGDGRAGAGDADFLVPNDADNSGVLQYVRIEYAGYAFQPDKEVNSLTMAAVGSGTTINHVQVTYAKDDAYEWFGGTVNCKYLIAYKTQDDDFDTDNGYSGSVQFGLIVRDSAIADISKSESFESDNNSEGNSGTPQTKAVFSNITSIGPLATAQNVGNSNYLAAVQIRRNSSISIFNSVFLGWPTGILIDAGKGVPTDNNITANTLRLKGIIIAGSKVPVKYAPNSSKPTGATSESITAWFNSPSLKNKIIESADNIYARPFDYTNPDYIPYGTASNPVVIGTSSNPNTYFDDDLIQKKSFITKVDFLGGIAPSGTHAGWHKGWTEF